MKIVIRIIINLFLCFFILIPSVSAMEICPMSREYRDWLELDPLEREKVIEPHYCESTYKEQYSAYAIFDNNNYKETLSSNTFEEDMLQATISQSRYNASESGLVTSIKDQKTTNSCWAFTTNSLIETTALVEGLGTYDLSEKHIEYAITRNAYTSGVKADGLNRVLDEGGNSFYSSSIYFRHEGPLKESDMPFSAPHAKIASSSMPNKKALLDIDEFSYEYFSTYSACTSNQIDAIKQRIVKYGSAGASMYFHNNYLNGGKYYYYGGSAAANHAVVIVGWDDNINTSNFGNSPSTKGAWIVKNSWGTDFGENGYLYISYGDTKICGNSYNYSGVSINDYAYTYYSSEFMSAYNVTLGGTTNYSSTKFTKKTNSTEYLDKVSIEVITGNSYEVYISLKNSLIDGSSWKLLGKGTAKYDGITSVKFSPVAINGDYTIIVKRTGSGYYLPLMCKSGTNTSKYYYANISTGVNFYSHDGVAWYDYSLVNDSGLQGCEPVIYAYTKLAASGTASFDITEVKGSGTNVYAGIGDYYTFKVSTSNIQSYEAFRAVVYNAAGDEITNKFTITNNIQNGNLKVVPNNVGAGTYTLKLQYGTISKEKTFKVSVLFSSNVYYMKDGMLVINAKTINTMTKEDFIKNLGLKVSSYKILNGSGTDVTSSTTVIGTNYRLVADGRTLYIALIGDITGDGKILSNDSLQISRYLVDLRSLTGVYKLAADVSNDGKIMSNDSLLISRFLVGLKGSL